MADFPKISNCPIMEADTKICMCCNRKCEGSVSSEECAAMRVAYFYGYSTAESKYIDEIKNISEEIAKRAKALQEEQ